MVPSIKSADPSAGVWERLHCSLLTLYLYARHWLSRSLRLTLDLMLAPCARCCLCLQLFLQLCWQFLSLPRGGRRGGRGREEDGGGRRARDLNRRRQAGAGLGAQAGATTGNSKIDFKRIRSLFVKPVDHYAVEVVPVAMLVRGYPEAENQTANKQTDLTPHLYAQHCSQLLACSLHITVAAPSCAPVLVPDIS